MASLAESSLASVPMANLAALELHLLQFRRAQRQPEAGTDNLKDETGNALPTNATTDDASAVIPESVDAYRTPHTSPSAPQPRLSSSRSAPLAELEAMVQHSPSQQAFMAIARAESFHGYPGGDTQPMESQVYRDYTESMAAKSSRTTTTPPKDKMMIYVSPDGKCTTYDTTIDRTPRTCAEGETGFIDLANAWQQSDSQGAKSPTSDIEELLASPETQLYLPADAQKPTMPETPAVAGHKRRRSDEAPTSAATSAKKTPGYSQLFGDGFKAQTMGATQLFDQTQAPSSPLPYAPRSDPVLTRPSPNINHRPSLSSPAAAMSSPIATMHGRLPSSTAGEPRDNYTSMRESQERRAALLRAELSLPTFDDDDEDDEDSQQRRFMQRRLQRVRSDQELGNWAKLTAPSRPGSRPTSSRKQVATIDLVTPATMRKGERVEFSISDDEHDAEEDEPLNGDDAELPLDDEDHDRHSVDEQYIEDDVYDELGQTVLQSQPDYTLHDDERDPEIESDCGADEQQDNVGDDHVDTPGANSRLQEVGVGGKETANEERATTPTQRSAIADSQPLRQQQASSVPQRVSHQQSPMSSFVPGSQYAGKTSQELAHVRARSLRHFTASQPQSMDKLPSSPPLPAPGETVPEGSVEASLARREMLTRFQPHAQPGHVYPIEPEIPESDILASDATRPATSYSVAATHAAAHGETNSVPVPFSTARTHISASANPSPAKSPLKTVNSQVSAIASPRGLAGVRRFADIAADPSPPNGSGETELDVDALMDDVMTAEDREFIEAVSSPVSEKASKRRKLTHRAERCVSSRSVTPMMVVQQALRSQSMTPIKNIQQTAPSALSAEVVMSEDEQETPRAHIITAKTAVDGMEAVEPSHLQDSASKADELSISTPEHTGLPKGTQESVKRREEAGAKVVSQLLSTRAARPAKATKLSGNGRKTSTAVADDAAPAKTATGAKELKVKVEPKQAVAAGRRRNGRLSSRRRDSPLADVQAEQLNAPTDQEMRLPSTEFEKAAENVEAAESDNSPAIAAPTRVLALFKGNFNNFYPATWLSSSYDGKTHKVRFDDETVTNIDAYQTRSLHLRVGDYVKVDGPGWRNKVWIVQGFGRVAVNEEDRAVGTDIYGRTIVKVQAKASRNSLPAKGPVNDQSDGKVHEVLISNVYITRTQWPAFDQRFFSQPETVGRRENGGLATPSTGLHTPDAEIIPASRSRRAGPTVPTTVKQQSRVSHLREDSVASLDSRGSAGGLFNGMTFAISYVSNETEKVEVARLIQRNGGTLLERGFDELFDLPILDEAVATTSPQKRTKIKSKADADADAAGEPESTGLRLKQEHAHLGFVALIADRHSRRAKYVQALALGLPTLSSRWIMDSLNTASSPLPWAKYLLAAGESAYLSGAIRSRTLPAYSAAEARLVDTIASRDLLLHSDGVLIVAAKGNKSKALWEKRKAYAFLTLALGAGRVKRVADLAEAKALVSEDGEESWKWVYVDGSVHDASTTLFGRAAEGGKKRKRENEARGVKSGTRAMAAGWGDGRVKVVNDEFVVQSLILGALVD
ncbi:hypothetical protein LTR08_007146 [Meristemomyces frigidus]|nr:hypothetical protein LTR08_007146 [Meristemomyces frigidus]